MDDDQNKLLNQATTQIKGFGFQLQQSIESNNLSEVLTHSVSLISELKSPFLYPKTYYDLYMQVFDQLSRLESYFMQAYRREGKISELFPIRYEAK